jgi:NAD(P)H-dependent FMN reductase
VRVLAICGSLNANSRNLQLLEAVAAAAPPDVSITVSDHLRTLPHFDPDLDASPPPAVLEWRKALAEHDAVLIAAPEYAHSLPGALKNGIDWVVGSGELYRKVVAITASVPHPERGKLGLGALRQTLGAVDARVVWEEGIDRSGDVPATIAALLGSLRRGIEQSAAEE